MLPLITATTAFLLGLLCGAPQGVASLTWAGMPAVSWLGLMVTVSAAGMTLWSPKPTFLCAALFGLGLLGSALTWGRRPRHATKDQQVPPRHCIVTGRIDEARQAGRNRWVIDVEEASVERLGSTRSEAGGFDKDSQNNEPKKTAPNTTLLQVPGRRQTGKRHPDRTLRLPAGRVELWTNRAPPPGLASGLRIIADCRRMPRAYRRTPRMQCRTIAVWAGRHTWSLAGVRTEIRKRTDRLLTHAATSHSELLWAILLGSKLRHRRGIKSAFARLGIAHVLVVSGLHLGMLALLALVFWRMIFTLIPPLAQRYPARKAGAWMALPTLWLYVLVAGGSPATIRAGIMATSLLVGLIADRPAAAARSLLLACFALLTWRPEWIFDPGFQLSFAATAALVWLGHIWDRGNRDSESPSPAVNGPAPGLKRIGGMVAGAILASLAAWAATAPLAAYWFGGLSLAGPLTNLAAVPFLCWLVLPLGLAGLTLGFVWPAAGRLVLFAADSLADLAARIVLSLAHHNQWAWIQVRPNWWQTVAALGMVALAGGLMLRWHGMVRPWRLRRIGVLILLLTGSGLALGINLRHRGSAHDHMQVLFLGRQAGNAIAVLTAGATVVIDTGRGRAGGAALVAELRRRGRDRVDLLVATHPHWDHTSGLAYLLRHFPVRRIWTAGRSAAGTWRTVLATAEKKDIPVQPAGDGDIADLAVDVLRLPGRRQTDMDPTLSRNDNSVALRFRWHGRSFVAVGDLEKRGQQLLVDSKPDLAADVLAAPHHGSSQSFLPAFLAAVDPSLVVISGHTATTRPELYERLGATVLLTETEGPLEVTLSPNHELPRVEPLER